MSSRSVIQCVRNRCGLFMPDPVKTFNSVFGTGIVTMLFIAALIALFVWMSGW